MEIIYVDSLFLLNAVIDYLILLAAGRICSLPLRRIRMVLGAVLGGAYAVCTVLPGAAFLAGGAGKLAAGAAMTYAAFGRAGRFARSFVTVMAVTCAFGGAVWAASLFTGGTGRGAVVHLSLRLLCVSFAVSYALICLVFRGSARRAQRQTAAVQIRFCGREARFTALRDTGNELLDPVSGDRVLVAEAAALAPLGLPLEEADCAELLRQLDGDVRLRGRFRLIPYTAIGTGAGLLPAFRPDEVTIDGVPAPNVLVAAAPQRLCADGGYAALF